MLSRISSISFTHHRGKCVWHQRLSSVRHCTQSTPSYSSIRAHTSTLSMVVVQSIVFCSNWLISAGLRRCNLPDFKHIIAWRLAEVARHAAHEMLIRFDDTFATLFDIQSSPIIAIIPTYMSLIESLPLLFTPDLVSFATPYLHVCIPRSCHIYRLLFFSFSLLLVTVVTGRCCFDCRRKHSEDTSVKKLSLTVLSSRQQGAEYI